MSGKRLSAAMRLSGGTLAMILLSACAETMAIGDKGCAAYGVARSTMPPAETVPAGAWGMWIADTDDRLTAACRG